MKLLSILKKIILGVVVLVLACVAVLWGANWSDDALTPAGQQLLQAPTSIVADAANGYFVLLGIDAPKDVNPLDAGRRIQAAYERQYQEDPLRVSYVQPEPGIKPPDADETEWAKIRCNPHRRNCAQHYLDHAQELRAQIDSHDLLLARYAQIERLPGYEEKRIPSSTAPLPPYFRVTLAAELNLAAAFLDIQTGNPDAGIARVAKEITFHRRLLASSSSVISKMVSIAILRRDYQALSDALEHWPAIAVNHAEALAKILRPLDPNESDPSTMWQFESRYAGATYANVEIVQKQSDDSSSPEGRSMLARALDNLDSKCCYLRNATLNLASNYWRDLAVASRGSAATLAARKEKFLSVYGPLLSEPVRAPWKHIRNPIGAILVTIGSNPDMHFSYVERVYDLDGYVRLVCLQAGLRREKVGAAGLAAYIQQSAPEMRDPYTGQPMHWDAATSSLWFEGRQDSNANPRDERKVHRIKMAMD